MPKAQFTSKNIGAAHSSSKGSEKIVDQNLAQSATRSTAGSSNEDTSVVALLPSSSQEDEELMSLVDDWCLPTMLK